MPLAPLLSSAVRPATRGEALPFNCLLRGGSLGLDSGARRRRRRSWLASGVIQLGLVATMIALVQTVPALIEPPSDTALVWIHVPTRLPPPFVPIRVARARVLPVPARPPLPKVHRLLTLPALRAPRVPTPLRSAPMPAPAPAEWMPTPAAALTLAASAPVPPPPAPAPQPHLGSFGSPDGLVPQAGAAVAVPVVGHFGASASADPPAGPDPQIALGGFGGGGFGPTAATGDESVRVGGFHAAAPPVTMSLDPAGAAAQDFVPPEILDWPTATYTAAASAHHVEGEVVLAVRLGANGQAQVLRVIVGLGYGLDAAASDAARRLQFHPARRGGTAVDSTVRLHVQFRLAY